MKIILVFSLVLLILISGCVQNSQDNGNFNGTDSQLNNDANNTSGQQTKGYDYVTEMPTGWFETCQEADLVLYGTDFGDSGGPLTLNRPGKVEIVGNRLILSDTWNNRVLIWNKIPESANDEPDLVLGQSNFDSNYANDGSSGMNWPMDIASDGEKLVIADTNNNRILIWSEFPSENGQPADIVLGFDNFNVYSRTPDERDPRTHIEWSWDVWTDGEKLAALSSSDGSVLIWNEFPTNNNEPAELILGHESFERRFADYSETDWDEENPLAQLGTVQGIDSDGERIFIGSYHPEGIFVYEQFPTESGQSADYFIPFEHWGCMGLDLVNDKLLAVSHSRFFIWNILPLMANQAADVEYEPVRTSEEIVMSPDQRTLYNDVIGYAFGIASNGEKLAIADSHNDRLVIWNSLPESSNEVADFVIGEPERFVSRSSFINPIPYSDGEKLIIGSDGFGAYIYNQIPDEFGAEADVVIGKGVVPGYDAMIGGKLTSDGQKLIMLHRDDKSRILIWNKIPDIDNQAPDVIVGGNEKTGRTGMHEASDVETDGNQLFASDQGNNRILVWNSIPTENQTPADFILGQPDFESTATGSGSNQLSFPTGMSAHGGMLAVADTENNRIVFWSLPITENQQEPIMIIRETGSEGSESLQFNMPSDVEIYGNRLFVADPGFHRVLIWSRFPENNETAPDIVLGADNFKEKLPSNTKDGLFVPASISFDGSFLWIGETKWSSRLLRFSVQ